MKAPEKQSRNIKGRGNGIGRVQSFREENTRIDYYPDDDALAPINRVRLLHPGHSLRAIIDFIVIAGEKAISGDKRGENV